VSTRYSENTALVVVDVQNDFADPSGGLYVEGGEEIVPVTNAEIAAAQEAGATVVYTQDWHPEDTNGHFERDGGVWPVHCVQQTWGAELHPGLKVVGATVRKGVDGNDGYSGFSVRDTESGEETATELGSILEEAGARGLVVTGLAGDVCVKATALDGVRLGYEVTVPLAATRFVELEEGDADRAVEEMREAGVEVVDT